jgi:beta-1,4-mannosyl-glycoprotein beta-1,4-N-acetylglucosaminyltransferase
LYEEDWMGSRICDLKTLKGTTVDFLRQQHKKSYKIEQGGWHFSFFGNADNFRLKIESYEHTENNTETVRETAEEKIENGVDPFGRSIPIQIVPIDDSYPEYIQNNQEKYSEYIKPCK